MTDRQAVAALGSRSEVLGIPSDSLPARLQNAQRIVGLTSTQSAMMLRRSVLPLQLSSSGLEASIHVFSGPSPLPVSLYTAVPLAREPA